MTGRERPACPGCGAPLRRSVLADVTADHLRPCRVADGEAVAELVDLQAVPLGAPSQRRSLVSAEPALVRALGADPAAVTAEVVRISRQARSRRFVGADVGAVLGPLAERVGAGANAGRVAR